ncbi:MAG: P-loop NTPase fold protein [Pyrinomonadaceae bacterium]
MISTESITIEFLDEDAPPQSMEVSKAFADALARAAYVNEGKESFDISFNSLFIGMLATPDATGKWIRASFERTGADLEGLLLRRGLDRRKLDKLIQSGPSASSKTSKALSKKRVFTRTSSARDAVNEAEKQAKELSEVTDTSHVLASLISLPGFHDSDFRELGIDRDSWAKAFREQFETLNAAPQAAAPQAAPTDLNLLDTGVEPHVLEALKLANSLAGSDPIGPPHVAAAIVTMPQSEAFKRFKKLVPLSDPRTLPLPGEVPDATRLDEDLRRNLARAQQPSAGETKPGEIWGRDLVTAVLLCPDGQIGPVVQSADRSLDTVRDLWYGFLTADSQHRPAHEWAAWWQAESVALPEPRRAGYTTETDEGDDKLGVDSEARAFARLILDRDVHAPLSIGLLGDWGSGKSFFIEQIKKEIKALRRDRRPELYSEIVEIEFNAWHASDSNIWASLVTNIFDKIWDAVSPVGGRTVKAAREQLQKKIEEARGAVHEAETQVELGQQALEMAERDLQEKREILALNRFVKDAAVNGLLKLAKNVGWHQSIETINDVEEAAKSLSSTGNRLRTVLSALVEKPILHIALPGALMLLATGGLWFLVNAYAVGLGEWTERFAKLLVTVAGFGATLVVPLKAASSRVRGLAETLETVKKEYDNGLEEVNKTDKAGAEIVSRARRELESTEASVAEARKKLAELMNQQATLDPRRRLGAFLQERVQSTQYRSQQGIISLVHKDFSELSNYMKDLRESSQPDSPQAPGEEAIRPFDRIVLYVDDLDRCRPAHVVNMLEAVHLLLALDLFVVIVAVDSRWLTRSLEVHYNDLLAAKTGDGMRASTPQSYLEKIFQITYALGPMDPNRFGDYVAFLAGAEEDEKTAEKPATLAKAATSGDPDEVLPQSADAKDDKGELDEGEDSKLPGGQQDSGTEKAAEETAGRPPLRPVRIEKTEREFISSLVPLLPTPRIAKRLVNVYRVIKAGKSAEDLDEFEHQGRARTCLLMLAILFGRPTIAADLLRSLHERKSPFDKPEDSFISAIRKRVVPKDEPANIRQSWDSLSGALEAIGITESVGDCAREPKEVARYSLVSGHDWHTWADRPPPPRRRG